MLLARRGRAGDEHGAAHGTEPWGTLGAGEAAGIPVGYKPCTSLCLCLNHRSREEALQMLLPPGGGAAAV